MKWQYRTVLRLAALLSIILLVVFCYRIPRYMSSRERLKKLTGGPPYLDKTEIQSIENVLGIKFPKSSKQIRTFLESGPHSHASESTLNCFVEFDVTDLETFKSGRDWVSGVEAKELMEHYLSSPVVVSERKFMGTEPIEWWKASAERLGWISKTPLPNAPDGYVVVMIENPEGSQVNAYLQREPGGGPFPPAFDRIYPSILIGWDFRDSKPYPKKE